METNGPTSKKKAKNAIREINESRVLRCTLTDDERLAHGNKLSDALAQIQAIESDLDSIKKQMQGKVQERVAVVEQLAEQLRSGFALRTVPCLLRLDFETRKALVVRTDTKAVLEDRDLFPGEMQMQLDVDEKQL